MKLTFSADSPPEPFALPARLLVAGMLLGLSSCGEKAPPAPASGDGARPTVTESSPGSVPRKAPGPAPTAGRDSGPAFKAESSPPRVMAPALAKTGKFPEAWGGRSAEQEEKRLRDAGQWVAGRSEFFEKWGAVDPAAAIAASRATDRDSLTVSTAAALTGWAAKDPAAAKAWVNGQPENAERTAFVKAILEAGNEGKLPPFTPSEMAAWLGGQLALPGIQPAVASYVESWSRQDREAAAAWTADAVPESALRSRIYEAIMRGAGAGKGEGLAPVAQWLQARPEGLPKDELLHAFVKEAAPRDPATSSGWAALIQDESLRASAQKICEEAVRRAAASAAPSN